MNCSSCKVAIVRCSIYIKTYDITDIENIRGRETLQTITDKILPSVYSIFKQGIKDIGLEYLKSDLEMNNSSVRISWYCSTKNFLQKEQIRCKYMALKA